MANLLIPANLPQPAAAVGWDGTDFRIVGVDAAHHLQVDSLSSALPAGAATEVSLAACLADLALLVTSLNSLVNALGSVATDNLVVRGKDQLFSYKAQLTGLSVGVPSGAGGYRDSAAVPAGEVWVITALGAWDTTSATTAHGYRLRSGGSDFRVYYTYAAFGAGVSSTWGGMIVLNVGDVIRCYFIGSLVADTCNLSCLGYRMTQA